MDRYTRIATLSLTSLALATGTLLPSLPSLAEDGVIIIQRTVPPRVATRSALVPDPHPQVANTDVSPQVTQAVGGVGSSLGANELGDAEFARITSGSSITSSILPGGSLGGFPTQQNANATTANLGGSAAGHGGAGRALADTIDRNVQRGLLPLQILGGGQ